MKIILNILIGIYSLFACGQASDKPYGPIVSGGVQPSENFKQTLEKRLPAIDSIMEHGIDSKAFPGAQILVARRGEIVLHKAYGYHTYAQETETGLNDLYDLASVTKILGPLPVLMKLYEQGVIDLDEPFSNYWPSWRSVEDKKDLSLREILAHQAGLEPYIVFVDQIRSNGKFKRKYVKKEPALRFSNRAFEDIYISDRFEKKIYKGIKKSPVSDQKKYRYSGLSFLIFPRLIEGLIGQGYEYYLRKNFFFPMGITSLGYLPKTKGMPNTIVPTEMDSAYRKALVKGWVHDENASLMGGISGNAGLFGSAKDVFKMMQLYVSYGKYEGKQYLSQTTVKEFTRVQFPENDNRRGLGFDKPLLNNSDLDLSEAYPAPEVSAGSFGHSGFTGTFVWADPKYQLVYVFLSNRVYPSRSHRRLYELKIRTAVQQLIYKAVLEVESFN